jgi:hypothetical protein
MTFSSVIQHDEDAHTRVDLLGEQGEDAAEQLADMITNIIVNERPDSLQISLAAVPRPRRCSDRRAARRLEGGNDEDRLSEPGRLGLPPRRLPARRIPSGPGAALHGVSTGIRVPDRRYGRPGMGTTPAGRGGG